MTPANASDARRRDTSCPMTLRQAIRLYPRPWIDGAVTFREWMLASAVILAAIEKDESQESLPHA